MKNRFFLLMATAICSLLLGSCDKDATENDDILMPLGSSVKQIDMKVMVPIHSSSLKYFDYVIQYSDNMGIVQRDTIRQSDGGIKVDEKQDNVDYDPLKNIYTKTFHYYNLPVVCVATIEMVLKVDESTMATFFFYTPKPYIYPNIYYSTTPDYGEYANSVWEHMEEIWIDMPINEFISSYGRTFTSHCQLLNTSDGIETYFY